MTAHRPWIGEIDITSERASELIRAQFPSLPARDVSLLGRGWDNVAVLVDEELVFRFPIKAESARLIDTETRALPSLAPRLPLPVPVPEWIGTPTISYPWTFAGYRRISGRPACGARYPVAARIAAAPVLGHFLAQLHAIRTTDFDLPGDVYERRDFARRRPALIERLETIRSSGLIHTPDPWLRLFDSFEPGPQVRHSIVHGDVYARHILIDDAGLPAGIIDWGDIHVGDPAIDLMVMYGFLPAAARPAFERAYGAIHDGERRTARLRAAFHAVAVTWYGIEKPDADLAEEGRRALDFVLED